MVVGADKMTDAIVYNNGKATYEQPSFTDGVRPSIYIRSDVEFTGNGTKNNPYQIVGDKKIGKQMIL